MLLTAKGLTKRFGGVSALEDVDFEVEAGPRISAGRSICMASAVRSTCSMSP
jgi:hypothetical protein